jgi:hypothetical protein
VYVLFICIFVQNPVGRIVNRFSKDQALVDELLPSTAQVHSLACMYSIAEVKLQVLNQFWYFLFLNFTCSEAAGVLPIMVFFFLNFTCSKSTSALAMHFFFQLHHSFTAGALAMLTFLFFQLHLQ